MSTTATAKRRRRQCAQDYNHLAPRQRPGYSRISPEKSASRLAKRIDTLQRMAHNKGKKKD